MNDTAEFDTTDQMRRSVDELREVARRGIWSTGPVELYDVLGCLDELAYTARALVLQAARRCDEIAAMPGLCADDMGEPVTPDSLADAAATACLMAARGLDPAAGALRAAHADLGRLYLDPEGERA